MRLQGCGGKETTARLRLNRKVFGSVKDAVLTDLMERPCKGKKPLRCADNTVFVPVPARGVATVLVRFGK